MEEGNKEEKNIKSEEIIQLKKEVEAWLAGDQSRPPKKAAGNICASFGVKESDNKVVEKFIKEAISCCSNRTEELKTLLPRLTGRELLIIFNYIRFRDFFGGNWN